LAVPNRRPAPRPGSGQPRIGALRLDGTRNEVRNFSKWFSLNMFAPYAA
jgi:hypothetical protein